MLLPKLNPCILKWLPHGEPPKELTLLDEGEELRCSIVIELKVIRVEALLQQGDCILIAGLVGPRRMEETDDALQEPLQSIEKGVGPSLPCLAVIMDEGVLYANAPSPQEDQGAARFVLLNKFGQLSVDGF